MRSIDVRRNNLGRVLSEIDLPGSGMIPAEQAVWTLLAMKLIGKERKSYPQLFKKHQVFPRNNLGTRYRLSLRLGSLDPLKREISLAVPIPLEEHIRSKDFFSHLGSVCNKAGGPERKGHS